MLNAPSSMWTMGLALILMLALTATIAGAQELPEGVTDHGVAAPVGMPAWGGTVAYEEPDGSRMIFIKLWAGGGSSYLFIDAETGATEQLSPGIGGLGAYSVIYAPEHDAIYDTMGTSFLEIDLATREIRQVGEIPGGMSLAWTNHEGVIFAGIYPSATMVSYDPETGEYSNYGAINQADWPQYLRPIAVDPHGWAYGGIGQAQAMVAGINLETGETRQFVPEDVQERGQGTVRVGEDGEVYANAAGWSPHRLAAGEATEVDEMPAAMPTRSWAAFADGSRIVSDVRAEVPNRVLRILDAGADEPREISFDYDSPGLGIYSMVEAPDGTIVGATGLPLRIWRFDPETGEMQDGGLGNHGGHVNQWVGQGDYVYGAVYSSGSLIEYDVTQPHDDSPIMESENPRHLHGYGEARDLYGRPHAMLAHPDGRSVIIGGNAARVVVGGGMVIYDTEAHEETVLGREDLIPDQGVNSMAALPDGDLIVGSTIQAPTAGETVATEAQIYRLDWESKTVTDRWTIEPRTTAVRDMVVAEDGLVYGLTQDSRIFVFDPESGDFLHDEEVTDYGPVTGSQAPRTMAIGPDGDIYVLFRNAIARVEPGTFEHSEVVRPPLNISAGVTVADGRLYFACGSRLFSYDLGAAVD